MGLEHVGEAVRRLVEESPNLTIFFHVDLDGVCSAAIAYRRARRRPRLAPTTARGIYRGIRRLLGPGSAGLVLDLSLKSLSEALGVSSAVKGRGVRLAWIDHHQWPGKALEELRRAGILLYLDTGAPTATLTCRVLGCDETEKRIAMIGAYDDMCHPDPEGLVRKWRLVLRYTGFEGMKRAVESLAAGTLWPEWAEEVYREKEAEYKELLSRISINKYSFEQVTVAVVTAPPRLTICDMELWGRLPRDTDITLILYPRAVSIRANNPSIDAACIARRLGGGGHRSAAGAPRLTTQSPPVIARTIARLASYCMKEGNQEQPPPGW